MHPKRHSRSMVGISEPREIRGGASEPDSNPSHGFDDLADDFENVYRQMLQHNADAGGEEALPTCPDAWMRLANILQLRNSTLEHEVQDLQDTNVSLLEDVEWHIDAIAKLEDALREAHIERAVAFQEVLDLDAQLYRAQNCPGSAVVLLAASSDGESTDTNASDSGSSQAGKFFNDAVLKR